MNELPLSLSCVTGFACGCGMPPGLLGALGSGGNNLFLIRVRILGFLFSSAVVPRPVLKVRKGAVVKTKQVMILIHCQAVTI